MSIITNKTGNVRTSHDTFRSDLSLYAQFIMKYFTLSSFAFIITGGRLKVMPPETLTDLAKFIQEEMHKRDMSMNQFAALVGVSHTTISRLLRPGSTIMPDLDFLAKLGEATHTDICTLVALVMPEATHVDAEAQMLAERISRLPPDKREIVDTFLAGVALKNLKQGGEG